jgi:PIN domain nuclease of toxin-antitoxin system
MLAMKGRLSLKPDEETWFSANLAAPVSLAPLTAEIALTSCRLTDFHGDPADRIIVATAIAMGIPLITADEKIIHWNETRGQLQVIGL